MDVDYPRIGLWRFGQDRKEVNAPKIDRRGLVSSPVGATVFAGGRALGLRNVRQNPLAGGDIRAARFGEHQLVARPIEQLRPQVRLEIGDLTAHRGKGRMEAARGCGQAASLNRFGAVVIDASLFVPQSRERVFIVAVDADTPIPSELIADKPGLPFHPPALVNACNRQGSAPVWWRLPVPPARNTALVDIVDDEPQGAPWHTPIETGHIIGMMDPGNLAKVEAAKRAGKPTVGTLFRRTRDVSRWEVRFDGLAGCLRVPSGGSSRQTVMIVNGASVRTRLLSPRECARLMGLPDSYKLPANVNEALGLMGDGVVAPAVRHLAEHLLEPLLGPTRVVAEPSDSERLRIQAQARI